MATPARLYHIGFGPDDLGPNPPRIALLSGDPDRARIIAQANLADTHVLSEHRGLNSYIGTLPNGRTILSATSGMGAPSLSIVVNELIQVGIRQIIRVGTCGSIQAHVLPGSVVISRAALCRQGAANDIAPAEYPAAADPFLTVALVGAARELGVDHHLGVTASVDTFYEGQERSESANPHLLRWIRGITEEYRGLNVLNYEMESGPQRHRDRRFDGTALLLQHDLLARGALRNDAANTSGSKTIYAGHLEQRAALHLIIQNI